MSRFLQRARAVERARLRSRWVDAGEFRMHYRTAEPRDPVQRRERGRPVVLVHGQVVSSRYLVPTMGWLTDHHPVHAPDLPGFGRSEKPHRVLDVAGLANALRAWTRAVGLNRPVYLANSLGCQIVADLAARHPEETGPLVLVGPTVDADARTAPRQVARWLADTAQKPADFPLVMLLDYLQAGPRRTLVTFRHALRDRIEDKLPRVSQPVLVVRGSRDPIAPQRWVEELARLPRYGELRVIPGAGHTVNYTAPLELTRVVRGFLDRVETGRAAA
jgi:2-hydroxy-6-oxonona-2,4-dienedioate hydrolase